MSWSIFPSVRNCEFLGFFIIIMNNITINVIILLFNALDCFFFHDGIISIWLRFRHVMTDNLIILILTLQLNFQVILIRMNLISNLSLLNKIPNKLKLIQKQQKLPDQPCTNKNQCSCRKPNHSLAILQLLISSNGEIISKNKNSSF